ncbi:hypothetical protein ATO3_16450 [Marinibacterium profundimaris]|uniref:Uncharacterized protein n=2 Tax=Marinibacterium profundimaris TaxID=1679460 RepID=A0A225NGS8_9RHOB|nr:hypothetical protein ATO3_16450 [Marinibacterium profundimaris]
MLPERLRDPLPEARPHRISPIAYAGGMLALGAALLIAKPKIGRVPEPKQGGDVPRRSRVRRAAQVGRDGAQTFAPSNVTDSIGRSLMIGGTALLLTRILDEMSGRDGQ